MRPWKTLSRRVILDHSQYLKVESHDIQLPDGERILDWPWVITPDFVTIVVVTAEGEFVLFRQTKYSIKGDSLATAGGYIEKDESPLTAAKRELVEEVGYTSESWTHLGSYPVDGNRGGGIAHLYLAINAFKADLDKSIPESDDLEEQEIVCLSKQEVIKAMLNKEFKVLPWATAIALALHYVH